MIFSFLLTYLLLYKYAALFLITFIAAFLIPIPASTTLAASGAFAAQGFLSLPAVLLVAYLGNVLGDFTGYFLARRYGEGVLEKAGFRWITRSKGYINFKDYILDFPRSLIYFSRFLTQIGPAVNILSGLSEVPTKVFIVFVLLGEASYVVLFGMTGFILGDQWENNIDFFTKSALLLISIGAAIMLIQYYLYKSHRRKNLS